jgi:predicted nucleotidyltransferase
MGQPRVAPPALTRFARRLRHRHRVERLVLFGSRARGDALRESDVDLLIVSPDFRDMPFTARVTSVLDLWTGAVDLEPVCLTPEEFGRKRRAIGLVRDALTEGMEL